MDLKALSYNSTGFNFEKANFINFLMNSMGIDFLLIQEHMHLRANLYKIEKELVDLESFFIPAVKLDHTVCSGRPSGGLAIFWKKYLNHSVKIRKHPDSLRVQAIEVCNNYMIINAYFPTDPQKQNFDDSELLKCIADISWYLNNFPQHSFLLAGDWNTDFSRNSRFVNIVREFLLNHNLVTVWSAFPVDFTFSFHQFRNGNNILSTSCIDHFVMQPDTLSDVSHAQVIHMGDNLSNHEPIYLEFKINVVPILPTNDVLTGNSDTQRPIWRKATDQHIINYRRDLKNSLDNIAPNGGILCNDPTCSNVDHHNDLDNFCELVINSIDTAVINNIPSARDNVNSSVVPGWSLHVKKYRDDAIFWHSIWVSLGRPLNNEIHRVMKHTRNIYHYAVRRVKNNQSQIKQNNMLSSLIKGKVPNLIKELKSQRNMSCSKVPSHIDGKVGSENISDHFASKYSEIYNKNDSLLETNVLLDSLDISVSDMSDVDLVSPEIVFQAITCINSNKSDNMHNFKSNAILNAADLLNNHFTLILQSFLIHGYVPSDLITCTLKPIIKDNLGSKLSSDNYRAVGISSLLLKVLDWVIFNLFESQLKPSDLQFGFQKKELNYYVYLACYGDC